MSVHSSVAHWRTLSFLQIERVQRDDNLFQDLLQIQTQIAIGDRTVLYVLVDPPVEKCQFEQRRFQLSKMLK